METNEVSIHLCRVFRSIQLAPGWVTSKEVAEQSQVAERTARAHLLRLVKLGLINQAEVFPAHRYTYSSMAGKRNRAMLQRIEQACEIFGLPK